MPIINYLADNFNTRTIVLLLSTSFSVVVVMVFLNIITPQEISLLLKLSPADAKVFEGFIVGLQDKMHGMLDILSELINKLFHWVGVDIDLSKIKADPNHVGGAVDSNLTGPNSSQNSDVGN